MIEWHWTFITLPLHLETFPDKSSNWRQLIAPWERLVDHKHHGTMTCSWLLKDHLQVNRVMIEDQCHHSQRLCFYWWSQWCWCSRPWSCAGCCSSRHTKRCCLATGIIGCLVLIIGLILMVAGRSLSSSSSSLLSSFLLGPFPHYPDQSKYWHQL